MCWICGASNSVDGLLYTDGSPVAGWRPTCRTHADYLNKLRLEGLPIPRLYNILALHHEGVMIDILHAVDQEVSSHVAANVFVEVIVCSITFFLFVIFYIMYLKCKS